VGSFIKTKAFEKVIDYKWRAVCSENCTYGSAGGLVILESESNFLPY